MGDARPGVAPVAPEMRLASALTPVLGDEPVRRIAAAGSHLGPRRWWNGPLDIEGLALGSVEAVVTALAAYDPARSYTTTPELAAASFTSIGHLRIDGHAPEGWAPMSGFHRTADGWVRLHANYPHHAERLLVALGISDPGQLEGALSERTALDVEEMVTAAGGIATAVRTPVQWANTDRGRAASSGAWIEFDVSNFAAQGVASATERPLAGVRVLDLTRVIAGPCGTRLLGALGADVLRIDPPQTPELIDQYVDAGFDKRSAIADLRDEPTAQRVRELAAAADVVVLGYRPGALSAFGLDAASLRTDNPTLAVVSVDAWGSGFERRGFDSIVQAACGIADTYGTGTGDERKPGALPAQALDHATGMGVAAAAIALLVARRNGRCGSAELSLAGTAEALKRGAIWPLGPADELEVPVREAPSAYGTLAFVPPLLQIDGAQLEYTAPPVEYGSSALAWTA